MLKQRRHSIASLFTALVLSACAAPNQADNIYVNTMISGELMPGVYGQVNIGSVPDYVTIYEDPIMIAPQPVYAVPVQPIYVYVPPYHAHHWRDYCGYYNACARPVYFICGREYRPHYFEPRYYNTRVYDPPRVYGYHPAPSHNRHYETMHQREMNRDAHYHRVDRDKGPYYNGNGNNSYYRPQENRPENNHDKRRYDGRDRDNGNRNPPRQQFINSNGNNGSQQQYRRQPNIAPSQRNDVIRTRSDDSRTQLRNHGYQNNSHQNDGHQNSGYQNQTNYQRVQTHDSRMRERTSMPIQQSRPLQSRQPEVRQPALRAQDQQQRGFNQNHGGGQNGHRYDDKR